MASKGEGEAVVLQGENDIGVMGSTESSLLIAGDNESNSADFADCSSSSGKNVSRRSRGRKRTSGGGDDGGEGIGGDMLLGLSATTLIGLLILLAMMTLTILSVCLQRYSTNTYVDIIVPTPSNSTNSTVNGTTPVVPGTINV